MLQLLNGTSKASACLLLALSHLYIYTLFIRLSHRIDHERNDATERKLRKGSDVLDAEVDVVSLIMGMGLVAYRQSTSVHFTSCCAP